MPANVLAARYSSEAMRAVWSPEHKIRAERKLWLAVMRAQRGLGVAIPEDAISSYESVLERIDVASIAARERITRHDVKARIEEFNALAGHEFVHLGMTSRDLTENVEQCQVRDALIIIRDRIVATLAALARLAHDHADVALTARSHNVPAQVTTLGKRFASAAEEMLIAYDRIEELIARYPLRGIKGPVGTSQDELLTEGFADGQVGSSAMPHKMNARSCERVCGLAAILRGHVTMANELSGSQWNEGDVACSVVRRVVLPDAFFAIDGLFETFLTVLSEVGAYPEAIAAELASNLPFLATTKILMASVKAGLGREEAHAIIKQHSLAAVARRRAGEFENTLIDDLAADPRLPLDQEQLANLIAQPLTFAGAAQTQVEQVVARVNDVCARYPHAVGYTPAPIL
ncbi:MAG: adenylosuccinate lyase [Actinobacteria bacterium]|nr:adenylosuccinate lyase [Actinomycetota bacterium]